jgi:predicted SnoaL-like aldol condensation-catalyzing enzyme
MTGLLTAPGEPALNTVGTLSLTKLLVGACAILALSACGSGANTAATQTPPPVDQAAVAAKAQLAKEEANKQMIQAYYKPGNASEESLNQRLAFVSPDFVNHTPAIMLFMKINKFPTAKDAFRAIAETNIKLRAGSPAPVQAVPAPAANNFYKILADGDFVTLIHERYAPDPTAKGKFYPIYPSDTFRIQDGKIVEHWDGSTIPQPLPIYLREPLNKIRFPKGARVNL